MKYRLGADVVRLSQTTAVALQRQSGKATPIDVQAVRLLQQCTPDRTLLDHAQAVKRWAPHVADDQILALLQGFVASGVLQPVEPLGYDGEVALAPGTAAPISTLVVVTADRPEMCRRATRSYLAHSQAHGHDLKVVIADGSQQDASRSEVAAIADAVGALSMGRVAVVGEPQRVRFKRKAVAAGFSAPVVDWLLPAPSRHYSPGGTRNGALLAVAGSRFLSVDDDTLCQVWSAPDAERGVDLVGHEHVHDSDFFDDRAAAIEASPDSGADLLAAHASLLGQSLRNLARGACGPCDMEHACGHLFHAVIDPWRDHRVRATWSGIAGDAAVFCPYPVLFATGRVRDRLAADERLFRRALTSREVRRSVRRTAVLDEPSFMAYCASLDNLDVLPPFAPVGVNEDGLFGVTLRASDPTAFIAQIPLGILHDSRRGSAYTQDGIPSASETRLNDVLSWLTRRWASAEQMPGERLKALGRHLLAWSRLDIEEFQHEMVRLLLDEKSRRLQHCEKVMNAPYPYPPFWREALLNYHRAVQQSVIQPESWVPTEYRLRATAHDALRDVRQHVHMWGEALTVWPELWQFARACSNDLLCEA